MAEMVWNHWTRVEEMTLESKPTSSEQPQSQTQHVLRPLWQRVSAVVALGCAGSYLAFMLIVGRSRIIQKAWIIPAAANASTVSGAPGKSGNDAGRQVFFQCIHHWKTQGQLYPYRDCKLHGLPATQNRKDEHEVMMKVKGLRGFYSMILEGSKINGEPVCRRKGEPSVKWARRRLFDAWAEGGGSRSKFRPNFSSGPAALNR